MTSQNFYEREKQILVVLHNAEDYQFRKLILDKLVLVRLGD